MLGCGRGAKPAASRGRFGTAGFAGELVDACAVSCCVVVILPAGSVVAWWVATSSESGLGGPLASSLTDSVVQVSEPMAQ